MSRDWGPGPATDALTSLLLSHRRERLVAPGSGYAGSGQQAAGAGVRGALDGSGVPAPPWNRNRKGAHPPVLCLHRGPEGIRVSTAEVRTRRGQALAGGQRRRAAGRRPRALCARPGVGPACLAPRAPSSSRGTHGLLARLPHPPRRSSASPLSSLFLLLLRERGRCLRAGIVVAGAWGGGGARAALCFFRGPWVGGARGRGLGLGPGEEAACGGRI